MLLFHLSNCNYDHLITIFLSTYLSISLPIYLPSYLYVNLPVVNNTVVDHYYISDYDGVVDVAVDECVKAVAVAVVLDAVAGYTYIE